MSVYFIELGDGECIHLNSNQVDVVCYDNNNGYEVFAAAICDADGNIESEFYFATKEARDKFAKDNGYDYRNSEWLYDVQINFYL